MVQRVIKSGKRATTRRKPAAARPAVQHDKAPAVDLDARLAVLAAERDAAVAELAKAKAEIASLEAARAQVVDRIDWIVDSLTSLIEAER